MLTKLKNYICNQPKNEAGSSIARSGSPLTQCYHERDVINRWQGDLFPMSSFEGGLPSNEVPYWMLANRTCQLVQSRGIKLPYLVFIAVYPLDKFVVATKNLKNQISDILSKQESCLYLPPSSDGQLNEHLVVDFNLLFSIKLAMCPPAAKKIVQLTSPFAEHAFQKFANYYYKVGYDDDSFKTDSYKESLIKYVESKQTPSQ